MAELSRIGIALETNLLRRFDRFINKQGYTNRSEAFRDLIRDKLVGVAVEDPTAMVVGSVRLVYDHHSRMLPSKLMDLQHDYHDVVIATTHAHLDHATCLEVIVLRGPSDRVRKLADRLIGVKGVHHRLVLTSPAEALSQTA